MSIIEAKEYHCAVTPSDKVTAYVTLDGQPNANQELFALVATNAQGHKVSVLLTTADAEALHAQLNDWCFGVTE